MREIRYSKEVLLFFDELFDVLIDKGYFSFYESSAEYLEDIVEFIEQNIDTSSQKFSGKFLKIWRQFTLHNLQKKFTNYLVYFL